MHWREVWAYTNEHVIYGYKEIWEVVDEQEKWSNEKVFTCTKCNCKFKTMLLGISP